jgi:hypothetical protein
VVEKALGVVNMRMHHLPSSGSAKAVADLRKKP